MQDAFVRNLRRVRIRRGISLESIAAVTNVPVPLWEALEENQLGEWPSGVLARTFVAEYARLIGENPEETVNEFCRMFPNGDRRRTRIISEYAQCIGQRLVWADVAPRGEERRAPMQCARSERIASRRQRTASVMVDLAAIAVLSATCGELIRLPYPTLLLLVASGYYLVTASIKHSLGTWAIAACAARVDRWSRSRPPRPAPSAERLQVR
jgi:transcriptional regulator with XRE-family HTH domain